MTLEYCHICRAEVDDLGGTCKQSHALGARTVTSMPPPPPPARAQTPPPPPPPAPKVQTVWDVLERAGLESGHADDPIAAFAPAPRMNWGPKSETPIVRSVRSLIDRSKNARAAGRLEGQTAN